MVMPVSYVQGDVLTLEVLVNNLKSTSETVQVTVKSQSSPSLSYTPSTSTVTIGANSQEIIEIEVTASDISDFTYLTVLCESTISDSKDQVTQFTKVVPSGFYQEQNFGGFISSETSTEASTFFEGTFNIPQTLQSGSMKVQAKIFSSSFSSLLEAIDALIQDRYSCFEQMSAVTYPMVMALSFLKGLNEDTPQIQNMTQTIEKKLAESYPKLTSYQTSDKGYEWFGSTPSHEGLSAYGLMQFYEMSQVSDIVSDSMVSDV